KDGKKAFLFCPDGVVSALKQPFFSKNSKKDKHQNDVCLQSEAKYSLALFWDNENLLVCSYIQSFY
ncbi:hypothetical protein, partial [Streptococcus suis]|uniref:hypothetical protein n=1 Tax=Streptococcus suis TaxID=1307 RepID=UPI002117F5EB